MNKKQAKPEDKIKELEQENQTLKTKNQELILGWQRTQADFENFRNRTQKEKQELLKSAGCDLMLKILPVVDNFELALKHKPSSLRHPEPNEAKDLAERKLDSSDLPQNDNQKELQQISNYVQGLEHIKTQLSQILSCEGLTLIEVKPGDQFDPNFHEALSSEKSDKFKEGQIISVIENGYKFGDRVLKPAKVKVAI